MSSEAYHTGRDCAAVFNYVSLDVQRDFLNDEGSNGSIGSPMSGYGPATHAVTETVRDVRGCKEHFSLEKNGFTYWKKPIRYNGPINNYEQVKEEYWPEVEELVKEICPTATDVFVYNTVPRISNGRSPEYKGDFAFVKNLHHDQVYKAHVDQDIEGAVKMVYEYFPKDAATRVKKRFQVLNVWRPITEVRRSPLAVVDTSSISIDDLASIGCMYPHGQRGSLLGLRPTDPATRRPRWYYKYRQRPEEVLIFTQFDNSPKANCWGHVAHSSFVDEEAEVVANTAGPRVSLEARVLVFYDEEGLEPTEELIRWQSPIKT